MLFYTNYIYSQDPNLYIFLCFGQSNMSGQGVYTDADKIVDDRFLVLRAANHSGQTVGEFYPAAPPLGHSGSKMGPADFFGRKMIELLPSDIKIAVTNISIGGQSIKLFDKTTSAEVIAQGRNINDWWIQYLDQYGGDVYKRIIEMGQIAKQKGVIKGILFHQGEADYQLTDWPQRVKKVYDDIITDLGLNASEIPMLLGELVYANQGGALGSRNVAVAEAAKLIPNANGHVISAEGCPMLTTDGLNLHFTREGYEILGARYAEKMYSLLPKEVGNPTISIVAPLQSTQYTAPANITITADALDADGTISFVEFYNGAQKIGESNTAPYSIIWNNVEAGQYSIKVIATDNDGKTATAQTEIIVSVPQTPYGGIAHNLPGIIEFEHFDLGGQNSAYFDSSPGSSVIPSVDFRSTEDVDIETCTDTSGGYNIGYAMADEWLEYTVNVEKTGIYNVTFRVACQGTGRTLSLHTNDNLIAENISIPNTSGWQNWTNVTINNISLNSGKQILRISIGATDYVNLNYMQFEWAETDTPPVVSILSPLNNSKYTLDQTIPIEVTASSTKSTITSVKYYNGTTLLYEAQTAPYIYNWKSSSTGVFTIIAEATTSNGLKSSEFVMVTISDNQTIETVKLRAGWNMIGCPIDGSTSIEIALSSIWQEIETIKDMEGFYYVNNIPALNSLTMLKWGEGYLIKVKSPCELIWLK